MAVASIACGSRPRTIQARTLRVDDVSEFYFYFFEDEDISNLGQCYLALVGVIEWWKEGAFDFNENFWRPPSDDAGVVP